MTEGKIIKVVVSEEIAIKDHAAVVKSTGDRITGFAETERDGLSASANQVADGSLEMQLRGSSPQGEMDTLVAARILVARLNADGADWKEPVSRSDSSDCESSSRSRPSDMLRMQVVRASPGQTIWKQLGTASISSSSWTPEALLAEMEDAIKRKGLHYAPGDAATIHLLLDANRLPAFALSDMRTSAQKRLTTVCQSTPFAAVWLVGPSPALTYPLYQTHKSVRT